jgi:hypothetical protein
MGWSCNQAAGATADAWAAACVAQTGSSNVWEENGGPSECGQAVRFFYEISNVEHADGAITGKVWRFVGEKHCKPLSGFRIEPDGRVSRGRKWLKTAAQGAVSRFGPNAQVGSGGPR